MQIETLATNIFTAIKASQAVADHCDGVFGQRCLLFYGVDELNLPGADDAPFVCVYPVQAAGDQSTGGESVAAVGITVGIANDTRTFVQDGLMDTVVYPGVNQALAFERVVFEAAKGADLVASYLRETDSEPELLQLFPLFIAGRGLVLVEPAGESLSTWQQRKEARQG